jgi:hypothetical protein
MIDAVLTHPHHPSLCGVVKFSEQLAARLGVPCHRNLHAAASHPLLSVKGSEGDASFRPRAPYSFDLFAHDATGFVRGIAGYAKTVYAANSVIAAQLRELRPDVVSAWCPSTIHGNPTRGVYNVLTFGMAHKLQTAHYQQLKADLDAEGLDYTVSVSTAVHEGSPWDETARVGDALREIFGDRLRVLGYLADDALARELAQCDAVALYFDPAVRENNTTYWAAVASGKRVITNVDDQSPRGAHGYTWERLTEVLRAA